MNHRSKQRAIEQTLDGKRNHLIIEQDCVVGLADFPAGVAAAVITDPPYGMSWQGENNIQKPIANDDKPFIWWLRGAFNATKDRGSILCFSQWRYEQDFRMAIEIAGYAIRSQVIWNRMQHSMGATHCTFAPQHDVIWFGTKGRFKFPEGRPKSVLEHRNVPTAHRLHTTQKPVPLMRELIEAVTEPGDLVIDPCAGSSSTGEAALRCGRRFIGFEIDQENIANANARLKAVEAELAKPKRRPTRQAKKRPARHGVPRMAVAA